MIPQHLLDPNPAPGPWVMRRSDENKKKRMVVHLHTGEIAWQGIVAHESEGERIRERLNGWEVARDFPPQGRLNPLDLIGPAPCASGPPVLHRAPPLLPEVPLPGVKEPRFIEQKHAAPVPAGVARAIEAAKRRQQ